MRRAPLVWPALALMAGIAAERWAGLPLAAWLSLFGLAALALSLALVARRRPALLLVWLVAACACSLGGLLAHTSSPQNIKNHYVHHADAHAYLALRLCETPAPRGKTLRAEAEVERIDGAAACGRMKLYLRPDSAAQALRYGDRLLVHGYPEFSRGRLYATSDHWLVTGYRPSVRRHAEGLRMALLRRVQRGPLDPRRAAVVEALALGWRAGVDADTWDNYRAAGIAHLLCVSGLHVGLLAAMAGGLLRVLGKRRRGRMVRGAVQLLAVWLFALLSGMAPSAVRAALMFSLFVVANVMGRRTPGLNILAAAALCTLLAQPGLLFDVGWQLSYLAVSGILLARPVVEAFRSHLMQGVAVSVAAQTATLPVVTAAFHRLPAWFLLANVALIPLSGAVLAFALLYVAFPVQATAWPVGLLTGFLDGLTAFVGSLPGALINTEGLPPWGTPLVAVAVAALFLAARPAARRFLSPRS